MRQELWDEELREIERYLGGDTAANDERVKEWLGQLVAEVRRLHGGGSAHADDEPLKRHGDALLDGSGTRHGEHEVR